MTDDKEFKDISGRIRATFFLREVTLAIFLLAVIIFGITDLLFYSIRVNMVIFGLTIWLITSLIFRFLAGKQTTSKGAGDLYFAYDALIELPLLTIIIYNIGTTEWMGPVFFLFPIVYTSIVFNRTRALLIATIASTYYFLLLTLQYLNIIPPDYNFISGLSPQETRNYFLNTVAFISANFYLISLAANLFTELLAKRTAELEETKEKLEQEKNSLEIKVQARTEELAQMAKGLEEKIKLKTSDLRERMEELAKINAIAMGREMKMIELKERIKKTEEELNEFKNKK